MSLPWEEAKAIPTSRVAEALGLTKAPTKEKDKWGCPVCGSSDSLHAYPSRFICFSACDWRKFSNIDLTMEVRTCDKFAALQFLAECFPAEVRLPEDWEPGESSGEPSSGTRPYIAPRVQTTPQEENRLALQHLKAARYPEEVYTEVLQRLRLTPDGALFLEDREIDPRNADEYGFRSVDSQEQWDELALYLGQTYRDLELKAAGFPLYTREELEERKMPTHLKKARMPWGGIKPMIVLPYWYQGALVGLRVRNMNPKKDPSTGKLLEPKYLTLREANPPWPFNADALSQKYIHVIEGEFNAYCLLMRPYREAAIGLAGAGMWKPHWSMEMKNAKRIVAWYDDDEAGRRGYQKLHDALAEAHGEDWVVSRLFPMIQKKDPNDLHKDRELRRIIADRPWRI